LVLLGREVAPCIGVVSSWNLFDLLGALICPTLSFTGLLGATNHAMRWSRGPIFVRANLADTERTIIPIRFVNRAVSWS